MFNQHLVDRKEIGKNNSIQQCDKSKKYSMKINRKIIERRLAEEKGELFESFQRETNKNNGCIFYPIS